MPTIDDGYILIGHADYGGWIVKINADGERIWEQAIGGQDADISSAIARTLMKNISLPDVPVHAKSNGDFDVWSANSATGQILWEQAYGNRDWNQADAIAATPGWRLSSEGQKAGAETAMPGCSNLMPQAILNKDRTFGDSWSDHTIYAVQAATDEGYIAAGNKGDKAWIFKINPEKQRK